MNQKTDVWLKLSKKQVEDYHLKQFDKVYQSTIAFHMWLKSKEIIEKNDLIVDVGCGSGSNLIHLDDTFPDIECCGIDINEDLVSLGNTEMKKRNKSEIKIICANFKTHSFKKKPKGILSYSFLSFLPSLDLGLEVMAAYSPDWIAATSLFYDGPLSCRTEVINHSETEDDHPTQCFYNTYSLEYTKKKFKDLGYNKFEFVPFDIDIDLLKPDDKRLGTYTERLPSGRRLQISGPLLMNWHFILAKK
ncbi:MAG: hypothetical protein COB02_03890 [Candidatus Cloacimonadota bacterium]|nr:MAG: hypothetical protein COB02_03890 [Candidatus Cloacimonadota bacterium]